MAETAVISLHTSKAEFGAFLRDSLCTLAADSIRFIGQVLEHGKNIHTRIKIKRARRLAQLGKPDAKKMELIAQMKELRQRGEYDKARALGRKFHNMRSKFKNL